MRYALAFILLGLTGAAQAQTAAKPQMTWSGYISGGATLYVQGNRVDPQGRQTGAVDRPNAKFSTPLPASRVKVSLQVRRGKGHVELVEQPVPDNEYAAIVQIEPAGQGPEFYSIDFFWDQSARRDNEEPRGRSAYRNGAGELRWSGDVDDEVLVEVRERRAVSRAVRGAAVASERFDMRSPLSRGASNLRLEDAQGRGRVELIQQPSPQNGFTATVRIQDTEGGRAPYSFRLVWEEGSLYGSGTQRYSEVGTRARTEETASVAGHAKWAAQVDGKVHVTIDGNRATVSTVNGRPVANMNIDFRGGAGIPYAQVNDLQMRKTRGRGEVRLIHAPDSHDSSLVFEVDDTESGTDFYDIEFTWR